MYSLRIMKVYFPLKLFVGGAGYPQEDNKDESTRRVTSQKGISRGPTSAERQCAPHLYVCLFVYLFTHFIQVNTLLPFPYLYLTLPPEEKHCMQMSSSFTCTRKKPEGFPIRCPEAHGYSPKKRVLEVCVALDTDRISLTRHSAGENHSQVQLHGAQNSALLLRGEEATYEKKGWKSKCSIYKNNINNIKRNYLNKSRARLAVRYAAARACRFLPRSAWMRAGSRERRDGRSGLLALGRRGKI